jgi:SH3 domain protein
MKKILIAAAAIWLLLSPHAWAENQTAYVTDTFQVTLRVGPGVEYRIVAMPNSGQPVEVVEIQEEWSRIRLDGASAQEGWILTRHLLRNRLPWALQAENWRKETMGLREKLPQLEKDFQASVLREKALTADLKKTREELDQVRGEYEGLKKGAAGFLDLQAAHRQARARLEELQGLYETVRRENDALASSLETRWFLTGALVLLCGLMIGVVVGHHQKKRKSSVIS